MVYLLHFHQPISPNHTCQHYIGSSQDVTFRAWIHKTKPDARLLQVAKERGIGFSVVRIWEGGFNLERKLKSRKNAPKLCPVCSLVHDIDFNLTELPEMEF
jgi:hypothetical protein